MKAEEARKRTENVIDEMVKEIYKLILSSIDKGEDVVFVDRGKLTKAMIKRLEADGYSVDTYGSNSYSVQW